MAMKNFPEVPPSKLGLTTRDEIGVTNRIELSREDRRFSRAVERSSELSM
jgi:hypothetical protein